MSTVLVSTYVASFSSQDEAFAALFNATGIRYTHSRLGEWRNGIRPIPAAARLHMLSVVLPLLIEHHLHRHRLKQAVGSALTDEILALLA